MISILMPSRGRWELAKKSIESLGSGDYEVLICIDPDDNLKAYKKLVSKNIRLYVAPERWGYANLHEYYNLLSSKAKGDWLFLWNDDSFMETKDWVDKISAHDSTLPLVLSVWHERDNLFPIISRSWYEAVGHFARNTHADSWVQQTAEVDGRFAYVPDVKMRHNGLEMSDNTHQEGRQVIGQTSESYRKMGEQRLEDARKISEYVANKKV